MLIKNSLFVLSCLHGKTDLESIIQQIYVFASKIRKGGRILIPESTYCHLPYGIEGMEILLKVSGLLIELPLSGVPGLLVATIH